MTQQRVRSHAAGFRRAVRAMHRSWRRSLQTRVVATTLLLSAVVSALLGVVILQQVKQGLLGATNRSAFGQLATGVQRAQSQFAALPRPDPTAVERTAYVVVTDLSGRSGQDDYDVVMLSTTPGLRSYGPDVISSSIPAELQRTVTGQSREAWSYTRVHRPNGDSEPALVVGAPVPSGGSSSYQLYYVFSLARDEQTLQLVERTMIFAGGALVLLLVGIAAVVTRTVVRPVRRAALTAERLAAGQLDERMPLRGEDELATLAASFNAMADTVQEQISQLQALSRMQRRFVADVSHELRTPVTTIRMAADVLHERRRDLPRELGRSAELLQLQLDHFEALLSDLLEISRHDAGAVTLEAESVDLGRLVSHVVDRTQPLADLRGSVIAMRLPTQPILIEADPRRIDRVVRNLVDNAVEYGEGRPVDIVVSSNAGSAAVTVRDRGVGLRPGEASLVFGRFWRADPARAKTSGGTGLGLSIALEDVRLHGGWLQASGEPGVGAVFRLTLPIRLGEQVVTSPLPLDVTAGDTDTVSAASRG